MWRDTDKDAAAERKHKRQTLLKSAIYELCPEHARPARHKAAAEKDAKEMAQEKAEGEDDGLESDPFRSFIQPAEGGGAGLSEFGSTLSSEIEAFADNEARHQAITDARVQHVAEKAAQQAHLDLEGEIASDSGDTVNTEDLAADAPEPPEVKRHLPKGIGASLTPTLTTPNRSFYVL